MKKYKHKRKCFEEEILSRIQKSKHHQLLLNRRQEIKEDSRFQAEYGELRKKFSLSSSLIYKFSQFSMKEKIPAKYVRMINKCTYSDKEAYSAWKKFCANWKIHLYPLVALGIIMPVLPIEPFFWREPLENGGYKKNLSFRVNEGISETDLRDLTPDIMASIKSHFNPKGPGRPPGPSKKILEKKKEMRKTFKSGRQAGKGPEELIESLQKSSNYSDHTVRSAVYSRKLD